ncbi:acyltransferase [Fusarium flagelliforme]|uniref:acyltransferase n=1 Tax=Fusarium flagelliforme TaxID=2675880 RepID=UPI001E8D5D95|nr:acyltransferase [Fusarium flagelliforme]KAH7182355.1 acyltransferase [Fusarium flagelliforme]
MLDAQTKVAFLSPLDQLNSSFYLRWSLVFHVKDLEKAVDSLSRGLEAVTTKVPYLKGRIIYRTETYGDETSSIARAAVSMTFDDPDVLLREQRPTNELPSLAKMKEESAPAHLFSDDLYSLPTFIDTASNEFHPVFEATYTPIEGGLILSMCVHHGVMDGRGLATLTNLWAFFARQNDNNLPPIYLPDPDEPFTRTIRLAASANDTVDCGKELGFQHYQNDRILGQDIPPSTNASRKRSSKIFTFSVDKLEYARSLLADNCHVTINSILSAVIWCNVTRIRLSRRPEQPPIPYSRFFQMVDGRRRLGPAIDKPGPYLGNVVLTSTADVALDVLATTGAFDHDEIPLMAPIAQAIIDASTRVNKEHISGFLEILQRVQDPTSLGVGCMSQHGIDFISSSWANLPLYECDFGSVLSQGCAEGTGGRPAFVRYPYVDYADGNMIVLPRRKSPTGKDEIIEVYLMLAEDELLALSEDARFCGWLKEE